MLYAPDEGMKNGKPFWVYSKTNKPSGHMGEISVHALKKKQKKKTKHTAKAEHITGGSSQ